jgi:hypothetical protein
MVPGGISMSTPVSQPVIPAQPDLLAYGVQDLALFVSFSRDTYLSAFDVQAPAWDPTRLQKTWFDSTADTSDPANVAVYNIVGTDQSGNWTIKQMVIQTIEASTVNLPGLITYPPYAVAPTAATRGGSFINPNYLSLQSDAEALMNLLGGSGIFDEGQSSTFPVLYPASEPRRLWDFLFNGLIINVGLMLLGENTLGIGSPGHWDTSSGQPLWIPDPPPPTGLDDTRPPRDMPVRNLLPNEKFQVGLMGVSVIRTDLQQQSDQSAGQFTADDRATLQQIYQILAKS